MIEPYEFVRAVTFALGLLWTVLGVARILRFSARCREKLAVLGFEEPTWRRWFALACLRATVLDPLNLALICLLIGLWTGAIPGESLTPAGSGPPSAPLRDR